MEKMNTWYSIAIGDGMWAPTLSTQIEEFFLPLFGEAGKPTDMAVFTRNESEGRLHCVVIAYFSPAAYGLSLLAGDPNCWVFFFPDGNL